MKKRQNVPRETGKELFEKAKELCEKEGREGWKLAQATMLRERASNPRLQEAIEYIMLKYQPDYFRPALLSFCCKAVGGDAKDTVPFGAALTLLGWAVGIHDDIIDQSKKKGRCPTVPGKFGNDFALILSDVLLFRGFALLRKTLESNMPAERFIRSLETVEKIWFEQSVGEAVEVQSRGLLDIRLEEGLGKIRMRASEMEACTRIGGIIGGGSVRQVDDLGSYGRLVGMMSILRNELIDMLEFDALRRRIRKESLPLPVLYALQQGTNVKLVSLIKNPRLTKKALRNISKLTDDSGGIEYMATLIDRMNREARKYARAFKSTELEIMATSLLLRPTDWKSMLSG